MSCMTKIGDDVYMKLSLDRFALRTINSSKYEFVFELLEKKITFVQVC